MGCSASQPAGASDSPVSNTTVVAAAPEKAVESGTASATSKAVSFCVLWRPKSHWPHDPSHIEQDYEKMVVAPPDLSAAAAWFTAEDAARVAAALVEHAKVTVPPGDVSRLGPSDTGTLRQLGKLESHGAMVAQAGALRMWKEPEIEANNYLLKRALRRAVPCAKIDSVKKLQLKYNPGSLEDGGAVTKTTDFIHQSNVQAAKDYGRAVMLPEWVGTQITISPGSALAHENVVVTVTKESKDSKFGVGLAAPKSSARPPPSSVKVPKNFVLPEAPRPGSLPQIGTLGSVLAGSGLEEGDELLWINHVELTGGVKQATDALVAADAGLVTICARRPRGVVTATPVSTMPIGGAVGVVATAIPAAEPVVP